MQTDIIRNQIKAACEMSQAAGGFIDLAGRFAARLTEALARSATGLQFQPGEIEMRPFGQLAETLAGEHCFYAARNSLFIINHGLAEDYVNRRLGGEATTNEKGEPRPLCEMDLELCWTLAGEAVGVWEKTIAAAGEKIAPGANEVTEMTLAMDAAPFEKDQDVAVFRFADPALEGGELIIIVDLSQVEVSYGRSAKDAAAMPDQSRRWKDHMNGVLRHLTAPLETVIDKTDIAVCDLVHMKEGDLFPIDRKSLDDIKLVIRMKEETLSIASGALGAVRGRKAVKLHDDVSTAIIEDVNTLLTT